MKRHARARWVGRLRDGEGRMTTGSGVLAGARYSFSTRFGDEPGTNPEELIAAAHAGCYSMSLVWFLGQDGMAPEHVETSAELSLENGAAGPEVTGIHLRVVARVPGADEARFRDRAEEAKRRRLVSRLVNVPVTLEARLDPAPLAEAGPHGG
jgi:osmotically inducible protein OsmC